MSKNKSIIILISLTLSQLKQITDQAVKSIDMIFKTGGSVEGQLTESALEQVGSNKVGRQDVPVLKLLLNIYKLINK